MLKKALITGITGQVGSQMADFLLENTDYEVLGMMRWQEPMENLYHLSTRINNKDRISVHYADLNDYSSLDRMIKEIRPDVIYHLAAQSFPKTSFNSPIETLQTNIIGTAGLLEVIRQLKEIDGYSPVVHVCSSSEVYGKANEGKKLAEDTKFHGASPYSISKIGTDYLGQFYGEAYGIKIFVHVEAVANNMPDLSNLSGLFDFMTYAAVNTNLAVQFIIFGVAALVVWVLRDAIKDIFENILKFFFKLITLICLNIL